MRVLHVIPYYLPAVAFGGPLTACSALAHDLTEQGHTVTVLTTDVASREARLDTLRDRIDGVDVVRLRNMSQALAGRSNCYTPIGMSRTVDTLLAQNDVCHVFDYFTWLTYRAVERGARRNVPVLVSPHGSMSLAPERGRTLIKTTFQRALGDPTIRRASMLHAITHTEAQIMRSLGVREDRTRVIPNGVEVPSVKGNAERFRERFGIRVANVVLFVGRLLAGKGVDLLLDVAQSWTDDRTAFVLVGPAENRPDLAETGWRTKNVLLTGLLQGEELEDAYAAATVFTLPSYAEGQPMTALEACARGLPVVLSDACNLPEIACAGAGITVSPSSAELAGGLADVLNGNTATKMGARGRALIEAKFSRASVHAMMSALYAELIERRGTM